MLEVIVTNFLDALNAEKGGAHRLEVVSNPDQEGLTPSIEVVKEIKNSISIPFRVMIRDRNVFEDFDLHELKNMAGVVRELSKINIDGIVVGFINNDKTIDFDSLQIILENKGNMGATFHRAFDEVRDYENSFKELINFGMVDRILTSGKSRKAEEGIDVLNELNSLAGSKITIVAGGSVSAENINKIKNETGITEFHVGKAVRKNQNYLNNIDPAKVRELVNIIS